MAKDQGIIQTSMRRRTPLRSAPPSVPATTDPRRKPFNPIRFASEVRAEARKVTWTSWKETWITSVMVGIMVVMTAFFFFGIDWILGIGVGGLLKLANAG
jgi:preprotein translocase subunit SecE